MPVAGAGALTAPSASPSAPPRRTVVDPAVNVATSVTKQLPGDAGSVATQTLQTVGSTADGILPPAAGPGLSGH
jgi:hypothetical protein